MRVLSSLVLAIWFMLQLSSCGDLIQGLRRDSINAERDIDRDAEINAAKGDPRYEYKHLRGLSANNVKELDPGVRRLYGEAGQRLDPLLPGKGPSPTAILSKELKRVRRSDFVDKDPSENSLWDGQGQGNYLFAQNRRRELGDLVTVNIEKDLKREIQYQLWLTLPADMRRVKKTSVDAANDNVKTVASSPGAAGDKAKAAAAAPEKQDSKTASAESNKAAEEAAKTNMGKAVPEDDFMRMEMAENMDSGLVKLTGMKRVVYRGAPRMVEVTAILNNKDIDDANSVKSSTFLDMQTRVIQ